jgi:asparagine synthase (glutamine-hydrolysing)
MTAGLAHTRLSIIDLSESANQPMTSASGRTAIVYNGEIYNYAELRDQLAGLGAVFRTRSDTEVLLNGYEQWGEDGLLQRVDGMFALALIDLERQRAVLARDPFGKKPCYYAHDPARGLLAFGSDIRSFRALGLDCDLDLHAVGYYFAELATPERRSIWRGIQKLPAGHCLAASAQGLALGCYWRWVREPNERLDWGEAVERTGELVRSAVRKRLVGDVPCAALLSGGVDSSLVVREMAACSPGPVQTYTVGFENFPADERSAARLVADRFGTQHTEVVLDVRDITALRQLVAECGEPFADCSALPTYLVARRVASEAKVVLTGDGGDEMFAGYYVYYFANKLQRVKSLGAALPLARALARLVPAYRTRFLVRLLEAAREPSHRVLDRRYGFDQSQIERLLPGPEMAAASAALDAEHGRLWEEHCRPLGHTLSQVLVGCVHTRLVNDHLVKVDRATMFASLEARAPLLDKHLARFAGTLPPGILLRKGQPKAVLKALAARELPHNLVYQEKRGFAVPVAAWMCGDLGVEFADTVLGGRQSLVPMDYGFVEQLLANHRNGAADHTHRLWALYAFHLWAQALGAD